MTTKVEQLVMGAFWEAAREVHQRDGFGRLTQAEVEEQLAFRLAILVRAYGREGDLGSTWAIVDTRAIE